MLNLNQNMPQTHAQSHDFLKNTERNRYMENA